MSAHERIQLHFSWVPNRWQCALNMRVRGDSLHLIISMHMPLLYPLHMQRVAQASREQLFRHREICTRRRSSCTTRIALVLLP